MKVVYAPSFARCGIKMSSISFGALGIRPVGAQCANGTTRVLRGGTHGGVRVCDDCLPRIAKTMVSP